MDWFSRDKQITGNTISYHIAFEWEIRWSLLIRFSQENQSIEYRNICWLVVSNMKSIFHFIYGMSSFPLTNSYIFQECYCTTNQYFGEWFNHIFYAMNICHFSRCPYFPPGVGLLIPGTSDLCLEPRGGSVGVDIPKNLASYPSGY